MMFATNLTWNTFTSQKVKCMLYLGNVLLRYVLLYNLKVSFNFHSTFLQLNVIENAHCAVKTVFALLSATFFELPITRTFFADFPWRFELSGIDCIARLLRSYIDDLLKTLPKIRKVPFFWQMRRSRNVFNCYKAPYSNCYPNRKLCFLKLLLDFTWRIHSFCKRALYKQPLNCKFTRKDIQQNYYLCNARFHERLVTDRWLHLVYGELSLHWVLPNSSPLFYKNS